MQQEKTICHKINESIKALELTIKTSSLNVSKMAKLLHSIRTDAQAMENGLKARKKLMVENNLEKKYQKQKKKAIIPEGVNKIENMELNTQEKTEFEFIVKRIKDNKIIYRNKSHAGVISTVEKIESIDRFGELDGRTQRFVFGQPLAYWFAFDQLRQSIEDKKVEIIASLKDAVDSNKLVDPKVRQKIVDTANQLENDYPKLKNTKNVILYTDGGSNGNGTDRAIGSICVTTESEILIVDKNTGKHTSNDAEFLAIEKAVDILIANGVKKAKIYTDSKIACNMVKRLWKGKIERLKKRRDKICNKIDSNQLKINFQWIPRDSNKAGQVLEFGFIQ